MISKKDQKLVKSILGESFLEELSKSEVGSSVGGIVNSRSKTSVSPEEIKIALQIVPRTILSFLFANLKYRSNGDVCSLDLPFSPGAQILVNKRGPDNYSGEITQNGARLVEYKNRSLPAIGLLLLSTFELYDMALLDEIKIHSNEEEEGKQGSKIDILQNMIDEKLLMHMCVQNVVERRVSQKEAVDQIIKEKLHDHVILINSPEKEKPVEEEEKKSKLREFLDSREKRREEPVELDKSEIKCPDCKTVLHKSEDKSIKLCICFGEYMNKEIKFKKNEDGRVVLKFPKTFDTDNVEILLDALNNGDDNE